MSDFNEKLSSFRERINAAPATPFQEVRQVETKLKDEVQLNVWISKELFKNIKLQAVNNNLSMKQIVQTALQNYLELEP